MRYFVRKLQFWWKAKNRHGVHSPFVFDFVEQVLNSKISGIAALQEPMSGLSHRQRLLISRIVSYYNMALGVNEKPLVAKEGANQAILRLFTASSVPFPNLYSDQDVVLCAGIHSRADMAALWAAWQGRQEVTMCLEIWDMGLLFFRTDFKEQQHFYVKRSLK